MQPVKKQLEILLMQYFKECYQDFPKGKIIPSESPDFIVTLKSRNNLGLELTRLNPLNAREPDKKQLMQIERGERIIEMAKMLFEQNFSHRLFVKFLFSETILISENRVLTSSVYLANFIRQIVKKRKPESFFFESVTSSVSLPDGLDEILIINHPDMKFPVWERSNNLGISKNVMADINESIHKKDEKLRLYHKQRLNYYWLLIITDRLRGIKSYNLPDKIMNHTFKSLFQHVFLFDIMKSKIFQLV